MFDVSDIVLVDRYFGERNPKAVYASKAYLKVYPMYQQFIFYDKNHEKHAHIEYPVLYVPLGAAQEDVIYAVNCSKDCIYLQLMNQYINAHDNQ